MRQEECNILCYFHVLFIELYKVVFVIHHGCQEHFLVHGFHPINDTIVMWVLQQMSKNPANGAGTVCLLLLNITIKDHRLQINRSNSCIRCIIIYSLKNNFPFPKRKSWKLQCNFVADIFNIETDLLNSLISKANKYLL